LTTVALFATVIKKGGVLNMKKFITLFIAAAFALGVSTAYAEEEKMPWENAKDSSPAKEKTTKTDKKTDKKKAKKKADAGKKPVKAKDTKKKKAEATK
jgi:hypothetical protein